MSNRRGQKGARRGCNQGNAQGTEQRSSTFMSLRRADVCVGFSNVDVLLNFAKVEKPVRLEVHVQGLLSEGILSVKVVMQPFFDRLPAVEGLLREATVFGDASEALSSGAGIPGVLVGLAVLVGGNPALNVGSFPVGGFVPVDVLTAFKGHGAVIVANVRKPVDGVVARSTERRGVIEEMRPLSENVGGGFDGLLGADELGDGPLTRVGEELNFCRAI